MMEEKNQNGVKKSSFDNNLVSKYCTECGTKVAKDANFCTNCGENLSKSVDFSSNYKTNTLKNNFGTIQIKQQETEWKPIVIGGLVALGVSFILGFFIGFTMWDADIYSIIAALAIGNMFSLFIGGLVAGVKASHSGGTHGAYAAALCTLSSVPLNLLSGLPIDFGSIFFAVLWALLFGAIGGAIGFWATKSKKLNVSPVIHTYKLG